MAQVKGKFIMLAGRLMASHGEALRQANQELMRDTGKAWTDLDPEGWYDTRHFENFMQAYARVSDLREQAIVRIGRQVYPTIKNTSGLPPGLDTPLDFIRFEAEGFAANHRGEDVTPRHFVSVEDRHVVVDATAPGYSPLLFEGVYLGILEMCGVYTGRVVQTQAVHKGDATDRFDITW